MQASAAASDERSFQDRRNAESNAMSLAPNRDDSPPHFERQSTVSPNAFKLLVKPFQHLLVRSKLKAIYCSSLTSADSLTPSI